MNTDQMKSMDKVQLEYVKNEIKKTYLYLIGRSTFDPEVIEIMKLTALSFVQRRYEAGETWQQTFDG